MEIKQLSTNGYKLTDVLSFELLKEVEQIVDTFMPTSIRLTMDGPDMPAPSPDSIREVLLLDGPLKNKLIDCFKDLFPEDSIIGGIELWRDHPGYNVGLHYDNIIVKNVLVLYLDGEGDPCMGTKYYEDGKEYSINYEKNTAILLLNSSKIYHGMYTEVAGVKYRKILYINWLNND